MKQGYKYKWVFYFMTLTLVALLLVFSFFIKSKRTALTVLEQTMQFNFDNHNPNSHYVGDSNATFRYLEHISLYGNADSSIYKNFFEGGHSKCYKIRRFTAFLYHASGNFSRSLIKITNNRQYYDVDFVIGASRKWTLNLSVDKNSFKIIRANGLENIIDLYGRALQQKNNP